MGDKDFVKPLLESRGTVHFGKVCWHALAAQADSAKLLRGRQCCALNQRQSLRIDCDMLVVTMKHARYTPIVTSCCIGAHEAGQAADVRDNRPCQRPRRQQAPAGVWRWWIDGIFSCS